MTRESVPAPRHTVIKTRVDAETRTRFRAIARSAGKTESGLLREIIAIVTDRQIPEEKAAVIPDPENAHTRQLTLRLPAFLLDAVKERARVQDISASRWVVSLIQSNLLKIPVMTREELLALANCTHELLAIGRNLNQVARILNADIRETGRLKLELLEVIRVSIRQTQDAIHTLARTGNRRWDAL